MSIKNYLKIYRKGLKNMPNCNSCRYHEKSESCPKECSKCSCWIESDESKLNRFDELEERLGYYEDLLIKIGNYAHDHSQGPTIWDPLWEIRKMAYEQ